MQRKKFLQTLAALPLMTIDSLSSLENFASNQASGQTMPTIFIGHGSPMNAIEENEFVTGFKNSVKNIPTPKAIICISAHWFTKGTKITAMEMPPTIHDFYGFPQALFNVQYPAKGDPKLARETQKLLEPTLVELDEKWGLDHGAWSVLKHLYPKADVPVIQLSIAFSKDPMWHYNFAKQLKSLRNKGILILGSGNIIHNLGLADFAKINQIGFGFDWAHEAHHSLNSYILKEDIKALANYQLGSQALKLAVPTPEHYLPLLYILALKNDKEELSFFNDKLLAGSLSMTSFKIS
jgi:4,5-DOPA dioxygenase extradiol